MIRNDRIINTIAYGDMVHKLATERNVGLTEARLMLSQMSFSEYRNLEEAVITPPSGQTIAPSATSQQKSATAAPGPQQMKAIWPGQGAPLEVGMTVGRKGPNGLPVPGQVSQVDKAANGVKIKNPTTGQDEWASMDELEPFMAQGNSQTIKPGQQPQQPGQQPGIQATAEDTSDLARMKKLAGIKEDASCGATGAGAIATAPASMGKIKRRPDAVEESPSLEHEVAGRKSVVGATGPQAQPTKKLSANNAARGKPTPNRKNLGFKK